MAKLINVVTSQDVVIRREDLARLLEYAHDWQEFNCSIIDDALQDAEANEDAEMVHEVTATAREHNDNCLTVQRLMRDVLGQEIDVHIVRGV